MSKKFKNMHEKYVNTVCIKIKYVLKIRKYVLLVSIYLLTMYKHVLL